jgi:glycosyltransferase involved in cell wall biosynthesis
MKIAQICAVDFTLYHFLLPLMQGMRAAGHDVVGICSEGPLLAKVRDAGFRVIPIEIERSFDLRRHWRSYRRLVDVLAREQFDLVHVHTPVAALIGRFAAWRAFVPRIVYTAHGFYFHERMPAWRRRLFVALEWLGGRLTDVLFTQSEEDAATARELRLVRKAARIEAIGNGVDSGTFFPRDPHQAAETRAQIGAQPGSIVIAAIGRFPNCSRRCAAWTPNGG